MENYLKLVSSSKIYDVCFLNVLYEVQILGDSIEAIYREDGQDITREEFEGVRDFIYENK